MEKLIPSIKKHLNSIEIILTNNDIFSTIFIICFIEKHFANKLSEVSLIIEKAMKWLKSEKIDIKAMKAEIQNFT